MTIERAHVQAHAKPWGVFGVEPWAQTSGQIGELWFERADSSAEAPRLQLKLLFTSQPLSIQVHPNDEQAEAAGFARGKTEAWYVLAASAEAKVGVGLKRTCSARELKTAAQNGAINALIDWRSVSAGDVVNVPAGTIHAIGAGLVIAEIQQRSDVTYRLYDYGRDRPLHLDDGLAISIFGPSQSRARPGRISDQRHLLSCTPFFCFEKIVLAPSTRWQLETPCETWLLTMDGTADFGGQPLRKGEALFVEADQAELEVGPDGATLLVAYTLPSVLPYLLRRLSQTRLTTRPQSRPSVLEKPEAVGLRPAPQAAL